MRPRLLLLATLIAFATAGLFGQGLETQASKDDWEEINFEFDSSVLVDGFPSLLRLADLLNQNPDFKVVLEGHADYRGTDEYNVRLSRARANMVRDFLVKYGARANQISIEPRGEAAPRVQAQTPEGTFMNRRVTMQVRDGQGNIIGPVGGVGDAIKTIETSGEMCCDEILSKLDKLDQIIDMLKDLKDENDRLKEDVAALKDNQDGLKGDVNQLASANQGTPPATQPQVEDTVRRVIEEEKVARGGNKFSTINLNAGPDVNSGNVSFTGQGRAFLPFANRHALQAQGEYMHYFGRDEGQFDLGLVNRWGNFQAGVFGSFRYVKLREFDTGGGLGQGSVTLDYVFNKGRVGFFGSKGLIDGAVVNTALLTPNLVEETYLKVVDQVGFSTAVSAWGDAWVEGNVGALFRRGGGNKPGGSIRLVQPVNDKFAVTFEAGMNESLVGSTNTGRFVVGLQLGNWLSPKDYGMAGDRPVPVDVPRVRYEILRRQIRTGNDSPVADAGPDQMGVDEGEIVLDGSGSFDPDGDPITYAWQQVGGPDTTLSAPAGERTSFTAEDNAVYHFRLTVRDDQGGIGSDRVTVSTQGFGGPRRDLRISRFRVSPSTINPGDSVTISWETEGAEEVEITPRPGNVDPVGGVVEDRPTETTTYTLTARDDDGNEINETLTVTVLTQQPRILSFTATPMTVSEGEKSTLLWETENADTVTIDTIGTVSATGSTEVGPTDTTTYTMTATNEFGSVNRTVTVQVAPPNQPKVVRFVASPDEITEGESSTLSWQVLNADTVTISEFGDVENDNGDRTVGPRTDTTYTLTATNGAGSVTATVAVTVHKPVRIVNFTANPLKVQNAGDPSTLTWETENAVRVVITPLGEMPVNGSTTVNPAVQTTYTLIAYGERSEVSAVQIITVENANQSPIAVAKGPNGAILVPEGTTTGTAELDGTDSFDPDGDPITYEWRPLAGLASEVIDPTSPRPTIRFNGGFGQYYFELIVRDNKGAEGRDQVQVTWVDP